MPDDPRPHRRRALDPLKRAKPDGDVRDDVRDAGTIASLLDEAAARLYASIHASNDLGPDDFVAVAYDRGLVVGLCEALAVLLNRPALDLQTEALERARTATT